MSGNESAVTSDLDAWRVNRDGDWALDVGYVLERVLSSHTYLDHKPPVAGRPGWNACTCGWEGYWPGFHPHVADHLRAAVQAHKADPE